MTRPKVPPVPSVLQRDDPVALVAAVLWLRSVNATVSFDARGGVTVRAGGLARRRATLLDAVGAARAGATVAGISRSVARIKRGPPAPAQDDLPF